MPEGPEIRREADAIAAAIVGREIESLSFGLPRLKPLGKRLRGARIESVFPHGKALLIRFDNGLTLYTHNQLFGRWYVVGAGERPKTKRTLRIAIETDAHAALLYSASQIALLDDGEIARHPYLSKLGPDLLDPALKDRVLARRLTDPRYATKRIGALLLDQSFLAGSGNYLRSEILFDARLHPMRRADSLDAKERLAFARSSLRIGMRAYTQEGATNDPRVIARLQKASKKRRSLRYAVYTRAGQACYRCGAEIVREVVTGRRFFRCPVCQPADSVGAMPAGPRKTAGRVAPLPLSAVRKRPRRDGTGTARGAPPAHRRKSSS